MMEDFIARTNWLNIKSNYFVNTIIIFNLSYYTNITMANVAEWLDDTLSN